MTQRDAGQDFDPKHRIIGAIVVVSLAVIFIPMVLGGRAPSPREAAPVTQPAEETKVAVVNVAPVVRETTETAPPPAPAPEATEPPPKPAPAPVAPVAKKPPAASPKPAPVAETKPPASGWVVQVGTFSNAANATRLERQLREAGQSVMSERIDFGGAKAVRLRVGPFADRAAASRAQERIQKSVGVKGVVLAYP